MGVYTALQNRVKSAKLTLQPLLAFAACIFRDYQIQIDAHVDPQGQLVRSLFSPEVLILWSALSNRPERVLREHEDLAGAVREGRAVRDVLWNIRWFFDPFSPRSGFFH